MKIEAWEVAIDTTRIGLERMMRALLLTGSTLTRSLLFSRKLGRGVSATLAVQIPQGQEERFDDLAQPITRRRLARVSAGKPTPRRPPDATVVDGGSVVSISGVAASRYDSSDVPDDEAFLSVQAFGDDPVYRFETCFLRDPSKVEQLAAKLLEGAAWLRQEVVSDE